MRAAARLLARAMPRDLVLSSNTPTATLELRQAQPLGDGRHFAGFLIVRAGVFAAALPIVFTADVLTQFLDELSALGTGVGTEARLTSLDGDNVLRIGLESDANVRVSGELRDPEEAEQLLRFAFMAGRETINELADGLQHLRDGDSE